MQTMIPDSRLTNPALLLPGAMDALQSLGNVVRRAGVPTKTVELIALRASQINGCLSPRVRAWASAQSDT